MNFLKEIKKEILEIDYSKNKLRNFGFLIGGILLIVGLYFYLIKNFSLWLFTIGLIIFILGIILPLWLKWLYLIWMSFAAILGYFLFRVFMAILFYLMITPLGWLRLLVKGDFLDLKINRDKKSYWLKRDQKDLSDPERMF
jgi:hypothetical protein